MPTVVHQPPAATPAKRHPLALTVTLPATTASAGIARSAVTAALHRHGLDRFAPVACLAVTELSACAARTAPGTAIHIELAQYEKGLRLLAHSAQPATPRSRRGLWLLSAAIDDWGGTWGVLDTHTRIHTHTPPSRTLAWIDLPH
ncbi:hypothetical protein ACFYWS_36290 [Streptomyces sp. NPDC002795]|uniref:hypothetical protein n=1 Tax=Streptomyces sp. NPDC002795 TaxID=3364665 RepID=UPI0036BEE896